MNKKAIENRDIETVKVDGDLDLENYFGDESKGLRIKMGISSIIGTRKNQQDTVFGHVDDMGSEALAVVCDGMGGMNGGEIASQTAVKILAEDYFSLADKGNIPEFFRKEAIKMNDAVVNLENEDHEPLGGGTTCVSVVVLKDLVYWLSVGDSKIYIIRGNEITAVNREHNYRLILEEKYKKGLITKEEFETDDPKAEALISFLGIEKLTLMDINQSPFQLREDDIILLCSDGLYKRLPDEDILEIIKYEAPDLDRAAKRLTDIVMQRTKKVQDNTSLILLQYSRY